jgi:hypothetical protein
MTHEAALSRHPLLKSIGRALPSNYYRQEILSSALWNAWSGKITDRSRFERLHRSVSVRGRQSIGYPERNRGDRRAAHAPTR